MHSYRNEAEIKQALGIESWRNLSKAKMIRFAMMMPDMDAELALKVIEQFPAFAEFATGVVGAMKKMHKSTLLANKQSQDRFHQSCEEMREILKVELSKDGLSFDEKKYFIEQIQATLKMEYQKDTENKQFLDGALKKLLVGVAFVGALGVAFVGGKVVAETKDSPEDEASLEA